MTELRRKLGHDKGKQWTAMLNEIADFMIDLRNQRKATKEYHASIRKQYGSNLGSMAAAIWKLPRSSEGSIITTWENENLCSNPSHASTTASKPADNTAEKQLQHSPPPANQLAKQQLPGDEMSELDWWADAVRHIELQRSGLV
jgi:hypothetical protein